MREMMRLGLVVALFTLVTSGAAAQTLDQSITPPAGFWHNVNSNFDWAQTFTAGLTGQLTRVDVQVIREASTTRLPLSFEIRRTTAAGAPVEANGDVLARVSLEPTRFPTLLEVLPQEVVPWASIDLSGASLNVREGDVLAVVMRSNEPNDPFVRGYMWKSYPQGVDEYPRGDAFGRELGRGGFARMTGNVATDSSLRTYVLVPEPSAAATIAIACSLLLRRR